MTFLSTQSFNEDGEIATLKVVRKTLTTNGAPADSKNTLKGQIKTTFESEHYTCNDVMPFDSAEDAESYIFESGLFSNLSAPPMSAVDPSLVLGLNILRAGSNIATHSSRGMGNTIVYHPINEKKVLATQKEIGENMKYAACLRAPEDRVLVLYQGTTDADQPLIYIDGEGLIMNSRMANVEHYGKFVKL